MKSLKTLVIASLAAASLTLAVDANAQQHGAGHSGGMHGGSLGAAVNHGGWHGGGSAWHGGGGWHGGGWHGGYYPRYSFYLGVPFLWPSYYYWGSPYAYYPYSYSAYDYTYPGYMYPPADAMQQPMEEEPTAQAAPGPGSPTQGPLYMNYCESSKAYYPKVASCPEGWKFIAPN